jgi:hypothetical protein
VRKHCGNNPLTANQRMFFQELIEWGEHRRYYGFEGSAIYTGWHASPRNQMKRGYTMGKKILGVILGYVVMFAIVFVGLNVAYLTMGADRAFQAGLYEPSMLWNIVFLSVGIAAAIAGGVFCRWFTKSCGATMSLAALVFVVGALGFILQDSEEDPGPRSGDVSIIEAMTKAQQPMWAAIANPIVGVMGVMVGGCLAGKKKRETAPTDS